MANGNSNGDTPVVRVEPRVSLGQIIQILVLIVGLAFGWSQLQAMGEANRATSSANTEAIKKQEAVHKEDLREIKELLSGQYAEIIRLLERHEDSHDKK